MDLDAKTILLRVDYNVPYHPGTTTISDASRIHATLPTINYLIQRNCRVILVSHMGRPRGSVIENLRLKPVADCLSQMLDHPVLQMKQCLGTEVKKTVRGLPAGSVAMLENIRFIAGEEGNDPLVAEELASLADIFVNDAFGAAHRAHASTEGVAHRLPAVAGFLMEREIAMLGTILQSPKRPFTAIIGGAKISEKSAIVENLTRKVDAIIIGGGMVATFLKAKGLAIGYSLVEDERVGATKTLIEELAGEVPSLLLPKDVVIADSFEEHANSAVVAVEHIPKGWWIMDIGPETTSIYQKQIKVSETVLWNGPMGVFEWDLFSKGTKKVAKTIAGLKGATTILGGGSTAEVADALGLADKMTHVSTGGGASLAFLEGKILPGISVLMDKD